jgi:hypothetical protein
MMAEGETSDPNDYGGFGDDGGENQEKVHPERSRRSEGYNCKVDTTYPRSLEGILRIITVVCLIPL